jgi:hypothetical protein
MCGQGHRHSYTPNLVDIYHEYGIAMRYIVMPRSIQSAPSLIPRFVDFPRYMFFEPASKHLFITRIL